MKSNTETEMQTMKFCPKCRSVDVRINITASLVLGAPQNWICNNCGYTNIVFPELNKLETEDKKLG